MVLWLILILVILYFLVLFAVARAFVYPFRTPIFLSPGFMGMPQEWIEFENVGPGKLIRGWWVPHEDPKVVLIACHGFMMNRAEMAPLASRFKDLPIAYMFFDFPAHGSSQGRKSGFGKPERTAVASAVAYARNRHPGAKIVLIGSSMGAAASAFALGERGDLADGLILDSCYDRLSDAIIGWWLFIGGKTLQYALYPATIMGAPLSGVNPFTTRVSDQLAKVTVPTLVIHGEADTLASLDAAKSNFSALKGEKKLVTFSDCNHSEARWEAPERYFGEVEAFLRQFC